MIRELHCENGCYCRCSHGLRWLALLDALSPQLETPQLSVVNVELQRATCGSSA